MIFREKKKEEDVIYKGKEEREEAFICIRKKRLFRGSMILSKVELMILVLIFICIPPSEIDH